MALVAIVVNGLEPFEQVSVSPPDEIRLKTTQQFRRKSLLKVLRWTLFSKTKNDKALILIFFPQTNISWTIFRQKTILKWRFMSISLDPAFHGRAKFILWLIKWKLYLYVVCCLLTIETVAMVATNITLSTASTVRTMYLVIMKDEILTSDDIHGDFCCNRDRNQHKISVKIILNEEL